MITPPQNLRDFQSLVEIIAALREPQGCPWDKAQTHKSLTRFAIEEAHELAEACDAEQPDEIRDELGDLLLQVALHSEIAKQDGNFDIFDVIQTLNEKMIRRHPHVFSDVRAESAEQVAANWDDIKARENKNKPKRFIELPKELPALLASLKIGNKARKIDFDWEQIDDVFAKVDEEVAELKDAIAKGNKNEQTHEVGDLLFCVAQISRHLDIDPEAALRECNSRFLSRVDAMMAVCQQRQLDWTQLSAHEKEQIWQQAKRIEKSHSDRT